MRKSIGVLIMSVMLALVACGSGTQTPMSTTYTGNQTATIPAGVTNLVLVSGQGAAGAPATSTHVQQYSQTITTYVQRNDQGGTVTATDQGTTYHPGAPPADYCDPKAGYITNGVTNYTQNCYTFADASYDNNVAATTGASATGFGKTFPGGAGGPANSTAFENVVVTAGGQYPLTIPADGSITISYYP